MASTSSTEVTGLDLIAHEASLDNTANSPLPSWLPINRVVAFLGPLIAVIAGYIATWLITNVEIFAVLNVDHDQVLKTTIEGLTFALTSGLIWLGQRKWLDGWQKEANLIANSDLFKAILGELQHPSGEYDPEAEKAAAKK